MKTPQNYFVSAGELSGDLIAADLVKALQKIIGTKAVPFGLAGSAMRAAGVHAVVDMESVSVLGVVDVLKKAADLRMAEATLLAEIDRRRPEFAVLVDYPGLHFRLAEQLKLRQIPVYQYVAPKLWAWGAHRMKKLIRDFRLVLGIFPFEKDFFGQHGVRFCYVGPPIKDRVEKIVANRSELGLEENKTIVALLPGSRKQELRFILSHMLQIKEHVTRLLPDVQFVMPLAEGLSWDDLWSFFGSQTPNKAIDANALRWNDQNLTVFRGKSLEIMAAANAAVVASGTATLECGLMGTPMVCVYATDEATYDIARTFVKVPYLSLVNIIAGKKVIPEYIQHMNYVEIAETLTQLIKNSPQRHKMLSDLKSVSDSLHPNAAENAAKILMQDFLTRSCDPYSAT